MTDSLLVKHREKIEDAKADIAMLVGRRLTRLIKETDTEVVGITIHTAHVRKGTGRHVQEIVVTDVAFTLPRGDRA